MLVPIALPECWFVDTNARLTEEQYKRLWMLDLRPWSAVVQLWCAKHQVTGPVFPDGIGRYGPLYGNGVGQDLTTGELVVAAQTAQAAGRKGGVVMFQHVRAGEKVQENGKEVDIGWVPTEQMGLEDAQTIVGYADAIGYSVTYAASTVPGLVPHIMQDLENVRAGHSAQPMAQAWHDFVQGAQRVLPGTYNGFAPGLTAEQFAALGCVIAKDMGSRTPPPGRGFVYEQVGWVTIPGLGQFDIAHVHPDETGAQLVCMGWVPDPTDPTATTEPAPPPSGSAA